MLQPLYPIFDGTYFVRIHPDRPVANIRVYDRNTWFLNIVYRYEVGYQSDAEIVASFTGDLLAHAFGWQSLPEDDEWRMVISSMLGAYRWYPDDGTPLHRAADAASAKAVAA
jgi:hypothetical protein